MQPLLREPVSTGKSTVRGRESQREGGREVDSLASLDVASVIW